MRGHRTTCVKRFERLLLTRAQSDRSSCSRHLSPNKIRFDPLFFHFSTKHLRQVFVPNRGTLHQFAQINNQTDFSCCGWSVEIINDKTHSKTSTSHIVMQKTCSKQHSHQISSHRPNPLLEVCSGRRKSPIFKMH